MWFSKVDPTPSIKNLAFSLVDFSETNFDQEFHTLKQPSTSSKLRSWWKTPKVATLIWNFGPSVFVFRAELSFAKVARFWWNPRAVSAPEVFRWSAVCADPVQSWGRVNTPSDQRPPAPKHLTAVPIHFVLSVSSACSFSKGFFLKILRFENAANRAEMAPVWEDILCNIHGTRPT